MRRHGSRRGLILSLALVLGGPGAAAHSAEHPGPAAQVAEGYAQLAFAMYEDSTTAARMLGQAIDAFVADPSPQRLAAARDAWVDARRTYSLTEAFRFGNPNVDAWEGKVNAWPLDEGFIDYVASPYRHDLGNPHAQANLIASDRPLTVKSLQLAHELDRAEANVATGFHAIEFLLWGQDLNQPAGAAGQRPHTDYLAGEGCTHGHCQRRARYLLLATRLLVRDLQEMMEQWRPTRGWYWIEFMDLAPAEQLRRMLHGLGEMSFGELAGERMRTALMASDQEEEQSCFSDTTHLDVYYNARGIQVIYQGRYRRLDGSLLEVPSLAELAAARSPELAEDLAKRMSQSLALADALVAAAEAGEPFDRQIRAQNAAGRQRIEALIDALREQTALLERLMAELGARSRA